MNILILVSLFATGLVGFKLYRLRSTGLPVMPSDATRSIGIFEGDEVDDFAERFDIPNPILTATHVSDRSAQEVSEPFMVKADEQWYMFFHVLTATKGKGVIGYAASKDCHHWHYRQIILEESFSLCYPYVFQDKDQWYMVPQAASDQPLRLYKAKKFPLEWEATNTIAKEHGLKKPSLLFFSNKWWLFASSPSNDGLRIYSSDSLEGTFEASGNNNEKLPISVTAGRIICHEDHVFRYAGMDSSNNEHYVDIYEIKDLTEGSYEEVRFRVDPVLRPNRDGWNAHGMGHIDPHYLGEKRWIACVDGFIFQSPFRRKVTRVLRAIHDPHAVKLAKILNYFFQQTRTAIAKCKRSAQKILGYDVTFDNEVIHTMRSLILPYFCPSTQKLRILFVGCDWYTSFYGKLLLKHEYCTIDVDPKKRKYGSANHHIIGLEEVDTVFEENYFDVIFCNGVFGWGLNLRSHVRKAFQNCYRCLKSNGYFVLGWDDALNKKPFDPNSMLSQLSFQTFVFPKPLNLTGEHRFNFYKKP